MTTALVEYTPQELELETAELLPARETLCCYSHTSVWQSGGFLSGNQVLSGNNVSLINFGSQNNYDNSGQQAFL